MIDDIKRTLSTMFAANSIMELRALGKTQGVVRSGYFKNPEELARSAAELDRTGEFKGIYIILNNIKEEAYARNPERIATNPKTTADADIERRRWFPVDLDPVREGSVSSSEIEHALAITKAKEIRDSLMDLGWPEPILGDSSNGAHLLWRIDTANDNASRKLIESCLQALSKMYSDDTVKVDTSIGNAARIWKLYGTYARKGDDTTDRPWRMSKLLEVPETIEQVDRNLMRELANTIRPDRVTQYGTSSMPQINMEEWTAKHGLQIRNVKKSPGCTIYILEVCPLNQHEDRGSAYIMQWANGDVYFSCHHDHCKGKRWTDLLEMFGEKLTVEVGGGQRLGITDVTIARPDAPDELKFSPMKAAKAIMSIYKIVTDENGTMWVYDNGVYTRKVVDLVDKTLNRVAGDLYTIHNSRETIRKIQTESYQKNITWNPDPYLFGIQNGVVDLRTGELLEYSPDMYITLRSPITYDPTATCPVISKYLRTSLATDDDVLTIIDLIVMLSCTRASDHFLSLIGPGGNGKKVLEELLQNYVGYDQVTQVRINQLENHQFFRRELRDKRLLINSEVTGKATESDWIKQISTGDRIESDEKYEKEHVYFNPFCLMIFDTNGGQKFNDNTPGFARRLVKLDYPYMFVANPDPNNPMDRKKESNLEEAIIAPRELSGLLNVVIKRAPEVIKNWEIHLGKTGRAMADEYHDQSYSVGTFLDKFATYEYGTGFVQARTIYDAYCRFCRCINITPSTDNALGFAIRKTFEIKSRNGTVNGKQCKGYDGVKIDYAELDHYIENYLRGDKNSSDEVTKIVDNLLYYKPDATPCPQPASVKPVVEEKIANNTCQKCHRETDRLVQVAGDYVCPTCFGQMEARAVQVTDRTKSQNDILQLVAQLEKNNCDIIPGDITETLKLENPMIAVGMLLGNGYSKTAELDSRGRNIYRRV